MTGAEYPYQVRCFTEELKKKNMNKFKTLEVLFTHCQSDDDHPITAADQGRKVSECDWLLEELEEEEKTPDVLGATIIAARVGSLSGDEIEAFIQVKL